MIQREFVNLNAKNENMNSLIIYPTPVNYLFPLKIKQDILMFDKLYLLKANYNRFTTMMSKSNIKIGYFRENLDTINNLIDSGYIELVSTETISNKNRSIEPKDIQLKNEYNVYQDELNFLWKGIEDADYKLNDVLLQFNNLAADNFNSATFAKNFENFLNTSEKQQHYYGSFLTRYYAILLSMFKDENCVSKYSTNVTDSNFTKKQTVLKFLLSNIPILDDETPWEAIFEYKSDGDSKRKYYALVNWVNEVATGSLSQNEIVDKYNYLYHEYTNQLKLHKQKTWETKFEVLVNAPLSTIENIAKIKFSKLLEPFFKIRRAELDLLEAETKITGRELAYIYDVNQKFK
ncbi:MAG TPA: hypothetical protein VK167_10445 [Flavipsychrobacter sp.]|nr:hypothetical protein [Flavipsychrobacter sp.]